MEENFIMGELILMPIFFPFNYLLENGPLSLTYTFFFFFKMYVKFLGPTLSDIESNVA